MNVKKFTQERLLVEYQNKYFLLRVTIYKNRTKANLVIVKSQFFFNFFRFFFFQYFLQIISLTLNFYVSLDSLFGSKNSLKIIKFSKENILHTNLRTILRFHFS